jgi:hypothetical protein
MNQVRGIFGFTMDDYIGKIAFPAVQAGEQAAAAAAAAAGAAAAAAAAAAAGAVMQ